MSRLTDVNEALKARGEEPRLYRGKGYYYFAGGSAACWPTSGVYVNKAEEMTVDEWLDEYQRLKMEWGR